ncbi:MAG: GTPase HflX, partial [Verrucomicrobiota bacterium]|nr:GTPase HflX [Verrucomicrobiota bacterium]
IEAFNATLEEAALSDFLIHVLDASQLEVMEFYNTTMRVLSELGADTKQMLVVFNKVDKVVDQDSLAGIRRHFPDSVFVSVQTGQGMEELVERISEFVARSTMTIELRLPAARADLLARIHRDGTVRDVEYLGQTTRLVATIPTRSLEVFAPFLAAAAESADDTAQAESHR